MAAHRPYTLEERIDRALADATAAGRTVTLIVIGAEDVAPYQALTGDPDAAARFGELRVKLDEDVFLSRVELTPIIGQPNAALL